MLAGKQTFADIKDLKPLKENVSESTEVVDAPQRMDSCWRMQSGCRFSCLGCRSTGRHARSLQRKPT